MLPHLGPDRPPQFSSALPSRRQVHANAVGSTKKLTDQTHQSTLRAMTGEAVEAAARHDPENPAPTKDKLARVLRIARVKSLRRAWHLP
jgi:hypothetical protein